MCAIGQRILIAGEFNATDDARSLFLIICRLLFHAFLFLINIDYSVEGGEIYELTRSSTTTNDVSIILANDVVLSL